MQIRTRLFLGTAGLVLALTAVQLVLHVRQVRAIERTLGAVATSVGRGMLENHFVTAVAKSVPPGADVWIQSPDSADASPRVMTIQPDPGHVGVVVLEERLDVGDGRVLNAPTQQPLEAAGDDCGDSAASGSPVSAAPRTLVWTSVTSPSDRTKTVPGQPTGGEDQNVGEAGTHLRRIELKVVAEKGQEERFLVLQMDGAEQERIPIPTAPAFRVFRDTLRSELAVGAVLLVVGMVSSGVLAHRLVRPLSRLAEHSEAVGRGDLGIQVEEDAGAEVGELQRAFNRMSSRLATLEHEREEWRRRAHLAELGDVARGLAHTVRNPLNTLGLAVEELADGRSAGDDLVATARTQIRRIDGWLRSFLALGAGNAAERSRLDLADLVHDAVITVVQQGAGVQVADCAEPLPVEVVSSAIRAALTNLLENAVQASPADLPVTVATASVGRWAEIRVEDHGPGVPPEVRQRLFEPHVTTREGGSGMGLFLARQLVVAMHGGTLEIDDAVGGGTVAIVRLPLATAAERDA